MKQLEGIAKIIRDGGIVIIPTDTIYAIACDSNNSRALDKMARFLGAEKEKTKFSFVFSDLSHLSQYAKQFDTRTYKLLKRALPGPYTFVMEASNTLTKAFKNKKKTVGIRVPENKITKQLAELLETPLAVASLRINDEILEYPTNAELIYEEFEHQVDAVVDGGIGSLFPSTIIDLTSGNPEVIREGIGSIDILN